MKKRQEIVAMIPARIGSTRLKCKNLALLNGKPLIAYPIEAAKKSKVFSKIVINGDHPVFTDIAARYDVEFYQRPSHLGSSNTKADSVVYDFLLKHETDCVAWVNPTSPLQTGEEVGSVINFFMKENLDSLITVRNKQVHCMYENTPVNFKKEEMFSRTQDLVPVQASVYSIMVWKRQTFLESYEKRGYALFCGKIGYYPVSKESSLIIKTKEDLMIVDHIIRAKESASEYEIEYDSLVKTLNAMEQ
jgi:CMP-N-acetylneuraminic acid synthetase